MIHVLLLNIIFWSWFLLVMALGPSVVFRKLRPSLTSYSSRIFRRRRRQSPPPQRRRIGAVGRSEAGNQLWSRTRSQPPVEWSDDGPSSLFSAKPVIADFLGLRMGVAEAATGGGFSAFRWIDLGGGGPKLILRDGKRHDHQGETGALAGDTTEGGRRHGCSGGVGRWAAWPRVWWRAYLQFLW